MKAPDKVKRLVEVFDRNLAAYKSSGYKEANVRSEFIDPLGWDVYNKQGYAEALEVITEDVITPRHDAPPRDGIRPVHSHAGE